MHRGRLLFDVRLVLRADWPGTNVWLRPVRLDRAE